MTKKAQIIIGILVGIIVTLLVITTNLLRQNELDSIRQNTFEIARNRVIGSIFASIEQNGEVAITKPDGNGGTKSVVLVPKEINK